MIKWMGCYVQLEKVYACCMQTCQFQVWSFRPCIGIGCLTNMLCQRMWSIVAFLLQMQFNILNKHYQFPVTKRLLPSSLLLLLCHNTKWVCTMVTSITYFSLLFDVLKYGADIGLGKMRKYRIQAQSHIWRTDAKRLLHSIVETSPLHNRHCQ